MMDFSLILMHDQEELTAVVMEDILGEPRVHVPNVLPTHPTLMMDSDFIPSDDSLNPGIFFEVQSKRFLSRDTFSISFIRNPLFPVIETLVLFPSENEDKVFNPGILSSYLLSHRGKITSDFSKKPMIGFSKGPFLSWGCLVSPISIPHLTNSSMGDEESAPHQTRLTKISASWVATHAYP
ncbi:hypothetical protein Tco_1238176 [Tanacetum coccineum]